MASTDAKPVPQKNVAFRVTFPILDADGDLVTGATGLDSEISKDGGTFADCGSEATEIATASGMYFLDLTNTEMNADTVAIIVKTTSSGAKTTAIVMYPEEAGDIRVNVTQVNGTSQTAGDIIGDTNDIQARLPAALVSGRIDASVGAMATDVITAASIAANAIGAAEIADGAIDANTFAAGAIDANAIATDAIGSNELAASAISEIQSGLATAAALALVQADTDDIQTRLPAALVSGRIDASVGAMAPDTLTASALATSAVNEIAAAIASPSAATIAQAVRESIIEGALSLEQVLRIVLAAAAGLSTQPVAGQRSYRDVANTKNRILATVSQGDRTAIALDGTA